MKKPKIEAEEQQPRKIIRADKAPTDGYSLVVDGHFKSHHDTVEAAEEAGMALKNQYQMLQVQVYDAATKTRSMIEWPAPVDGELGPAPAALLARQPVRQRRGLFCLTSSAWRASF